MFAKFSVKKPMSVLVAVVLVLILGYVAFTSMTTDLLPDINLPYVIVMTTYPGASPEAVEEELTRPIEQQMATLDGISSVTSTSAENYSLVMLEFSQETNMDTITGDIREKLNLINGSWDSMVGTPTILKLNPSMLPVAVVAVDRDDTNITDLSTLVNDRLMTQLEGIEGVASVTVSGDVHDSIRVELDPAKIDALNEKIRAAIDGKFADGETQIADGLAQVESGLSQANAAAASLPAAKAQLAQAQIALNEGIAEAQTQLDSKKEELLRAELELNIAMQALLAQKEAALSAMEPLEQIENTIDELEKTRDEADNYIKLYDSYTALSASYDTLIAQTIAGNDAIDTKEQAEAFLEAEGNAEYLQLKAQMASCLTQLNALGGYDPALYEAQKTAKASAEAGLARVDAQLAAIGMTRESFRETLAQLRRGVAQLDAQIAQLEEASAQLEAGKITIDQAYRQLRATQSEKTMQITSGLIEVVTAQNGMAQTIAQMESTKTQLEEASEQLKDAKRAAYDKADLSSILTVSQLSMILGAQNFSMPAGYVDDAGGTSYLVRVGDKLTEEQLDRLLLFDLGLDGLEPIYLSDVAEIRVTDNSDEVYAKINGNEGIMLSFAKQSNYSTTVSAENIDKTLEKLSEQYEGLHFTSMMNQGDYINIVVDSVLNNLLVGAILAIVILFLFLWDIRPTLVTACSIPISLTFALTLMYFSGVTLNIISLAGLAVAVGMLVDNSIVVIENIYRMRALGLPAKEAAIKGAGQVAAAVTSSTLTTVCVFAPIVFVHGLTRQLFADMALTIAYALGASLIISLTLVPAMCAGMLRKPPKGRKKKAKKNGGVYERTLRALLRAKPLVLLMAVALLVCSIFAGFSNGFAYMPEMASTEIMVNIQMNDEDGTLAQTIETCDAFAEKIREIDGVETVGVMLSSGVASVIGLSADADPTSATMYVLTDPDERVYGVEDKIEAIAADYPCNVTVTGGSSMMNYSSALGGSGVEVDLYGDDLDALREGAQTVAAYLEQVEGTSDVSDGIGETTPELRISVDKDAAMKNGLTVAQVYQQIAAAVKTSATATSIRLDDTDVDVVVFSADAETLTIDDVRNYTVTASGPDGTQKEVVLSDIADITMTQTMDAISHRAQRRMLSVTASIADGYNVSNVTSAAQRASKNWELPGGVSIVFTGENETIMSSMKDLAKMLALGIAIIYLIMVAQFQSLLSPFIVMFTIPLAFTGGLFALALCGMEMSIVAMIGFIMLVGIIVNNGIVLVDYANQLCAEGRTVREAIVEAGVTRMRPVLMTVLTTVLGLLPLALGRGYGADLMQPVAVVCIGGLVYATLMTLFVIPVMYEMFLRGREKRQQRRAAEAALTAQETEPQDRDESAMRQREGE